MKTNTTSFQAHYTAVLAGFFSLALLTPAIAADFSGSLKGLTITDAQATNKPPVATFNYSANDDTINFDAANSTDSDGAISTYSWNFGDNSTGSGPKVSHTYQDYGTFPVTLTVTDNNGGVSLTQSTVQTAPNINTVFTSGTNYSYASMQNSDTNYLAGSFTATGNYKVYQVDTYMYKAGTPNGTYTLEIRENISNSPGIILSNGSSSDTYKAADLTGTFSNRQLTTFNLPGATLTSGTKYWVVIKSTDADGDANYIGSTKTNSNVTEYLKKSTTGSSWNQLSASQSLHFVIKGK